MAAQRARLVRRKRPRVFSSAEAAARRESARAASTCGRRHRLRRRLDDARVFRAKRRARARGGARRTTTPRGKVDAARREAAAQRRGAGGCGRRPAPSAVAGRGRREAAWQRRRSSRTRTPLVGARRCGVSAGGDLQFDARQALARRRCEVDLAAGTRQRFLRASTRAPQRREPSSSDRASDASQTQRARAAIRRK